ncbi:MAG: tetratricopeptide repeat protein, partial [bacterium]
MFLTSSAFGQTIEARAAFKKGYELLEQKKNYLAIDNLKIATQDTSFPLLDYSYSYIAEAYRQKNHRQEAIQVYNIVPKYFKNSILIPNCLIAMAELNADDQEYESAVKILQEFLAIFPKHESSPKARYLLGVYLTKLDRPEEAARVFRNLDLLHGSSYFAEKAIEQLDKLAKTTHLAGYEAPAASVYNLGIKYFKASDNTKAKEYFTRLSRFYKKSSLYDEAIMMLGRVALRQGKLDQAANYFKKAINLNQDSKPESMFYLARTYGYENDFAAAIVLLEKVPQDYPAHHIADDALYYLSKYYQALDQSEKAMGPLAQIIANYPASEFIDEATWTIGNNLYKKQEYKAAHDIFNKINSARTIFWSAKCADKEGQRDEAIK